MGVGLQHSSIACRQENRKELKRGKHMIPLIKHKPKKLSSKSKLHLACSLACLKTSNELHHRKFNPQTKAQKNAET